MSTKEIVLAQFEAILQTRDAFPLGKIDCLDLKDFTLDEHVALYLRLFELEWHQEHENLARGFQHWAHPLATEALYRRALQSEPDMDIRPLARKCTWALADIGTPEAKARLEQLAACGDRAVEGFARKRLDNWEKELPRKGPKLWLGWPPGGKIDLNRYVDNLAKIPQTGEHITAYQTNDTVVVYQAYRAEIAGYAEARQRFGGEHFSFDRMSWIKPNFLWMMYRSGWATKENQERVLAIGVRKSFFQKLLEKGVASSFQDKYQEPSIWQRLLGESEVRIQWDPAHDPYGARLPWRNIQIGLKGRVLKEFATKQLVFIVDITEFVHQQKLYVERKEIERLLVPEETVYLPIAR